MSSILYLPVYCVSSNTTSSRVKIVLSNGPIYAGIFSQFLNANIKLSIFEVA